MAQSRQQAFQQLRTPCVDLSATALKFKGNQASVKAVSLSLEKVRQVLRSLGEKNYLDEKLAEYAFFPLTHVFNQSQRLSSSALELAVQCVDILVSKGWRDKIAPEMAKQLLILIGLLVSRSPKQQLEPATDELKIASFTCMTSIIEQTTHSKDGALAGSGTQSIIDQLVYQLLEVMTESSSDAVQSSAAKALLQLQLAIRDIQLLASLLPRTVSSLVKVLRSSTQSKRSRKTLATYLDLFTEVIRSVLADDVLHSQPGYDTRSSEGPIVLDKTWLGATAPQIDLALVQVTKLRNNDNIQVTEALLRLCEMIINECSSTLAQSLPLVIETTAVLCRSEATTKAQAFLKHTVLTRPEVADMLTAKLYDWSQALPRVMQGSEDRPKQLLLKQLTASFNVLSETSSLSDQEISQVATTLVKTVATAMETGAKPSPLVSETLQIPVTELVRETSASQVFQSVVLHHQSQRSSAAELHDLIDLLKTQSFGKNITRSFVDQLDDPNPMRQVAASWLALRFLTDDQINGLDVMDFVVDDISTGDFRLSRPFLVSELYASTVPFLIEGSSVSGTDLPVWTLIALSLEVLIMQASQLGESYRPELMETLFPVLALLDSNNAVLQQHAVTTLNLLAKATNYQSSADMLIENVDYLINAVALRLNAFDISRTSLQVLSMMLRLCGARLLPYLDDLIGNIFSALDNFHGYPSLVEQLFEILRLIVTESSKVPSMLALEAGKSSPPPRKGDESGCSAIDAIISDLRARKQRRNQVHEEEEKPVSAPQRPWSGDNDVAATKSADTDPAEVVGEDDDGPLPNNSKEDENKVSKPHQLLLNIAQSTVPHLSSPSPKVRLTLLELLDEISPLLSRHENTYLPLINSIWPPVVDRLLSVTPGEHGDSAYNVKAAAVTITTLCREAGDFMSSRIGDVFLDLASLFKHIYKNVMGSKQRTSDDGQLLVIAALDGVPKHDLVPKFDSSAFSGAGRTPSNEISLGNARSAEGQILEVLINLFVAILTNVRIAEENIDTIYDILAPFMHFAAVHTALFQHNADNVWLIRHQPR